MSGNVYEWCWNYFKDYEKNYRNIVYSADFERVLRGGNFYSNEFGCSCVYRYSTLPDETAFSVGFRIVRTA